MLQQKALTSAHIETTVRHSLFLNAQHIDVRIRSILWSSAWTVDTTHPSCREKWTAANQHDRILPSIGQCMVTTDLQMDLYPGSAKLLVDIDDPERPDLVSHYLFWKDAHTVCDIHSTASFRAAASQLVHLITSGYLPLNKSPLSDLTGTQFSEGSKIVFIDPLSDKYVNDNLDYTERDRTFAWRKVALVQNFNNAVRTDYNVNIAFLQEVVNPNEVTPYNTIFEVEPIRRLLR